jgi:hypothetical protein
VKIVIIIDAAKGCYADGSADEAITAMLPGWFGKAYVNQG